MTKTNNIRIAGSLHILAGVLLAASFFMPWISWDSISVKGSDMPGGGFFTKAENAAGIANPFASISFLFYAFFLVPVLAVVSVALVLLKKNAFWPAAIAGLASISLLIVYCLFTQNIKSNGLITSSSCTTWYVVQAVAAVALILMAGQSKWLLKAGLMLITVLGTYFGFKAVSSKLEKDIMSETHQTTDKIKPDFTTSAEVLIKEFITNDTASNKKYREKVVEVNGIVNAAEIAADSTSTLKFADSTGSYAIFSIEKTELERVKAIKAGDQVTVRGVCSGSIFSEILGTTSINFKRSVIQQKQ